MRPLKKSALLKLRLQTASRAWRAWAKYGKIKHPVKNGWRNQSAFQNLKVGDHPISMNIVLESTSQCFHSIQQVSSLWRKFKQCSHCPVANPHQNLCGSHPFPHYTLGYPSRFEWHTLDIFGQIIYYISCHIFHIHVHTMSHKSHNKVVGFTNLARKFDYHWVYPSSEIRSTLSHQNIHW